MNIPDIENGGPLYFKVMMMIIISNTEEAFPTLTSRLSALKCPQFREKHQQGRQSTARRISPLDDC